MKSEKLFQRKIIVIWIQLLRGLIIVNICATRTALVNQSEDIPGMSFLNSAFDSSTFIRTNYNYMQSVAAAANASLSTDKPNRSDETNANANNNNQNHGNANATENDASNDTGNRDR